MGQDIRKLLQQDSFSNQKSADIGNNHELRFFDKLESALPQQENNKTVVSLKSKNSKWYMSIAASVVTVGLGVFALSDSSETDILQQPANLSVHNMTVSNDVISSSLAAVSPEFKEIEDYYLTSINLELAQLNINDDNKSVVDSFMEHLSQLDEEYKILQKELKQKATNSQTLEALIQNLQMRLELLQQLKEKLKNLNEYKNPTYKNLQA